MRETGEFERSIFCDARRWFSSASDGGPETSGWAAARLRPLDSPGAYAMKMLGLARLSLQACLFTFFLGPWPAVLTRLRLLMTSVLRLIGRGRPCSLRKRPQALQRTEPTSSRRHRGVVLVVQFWQMGCKLLSAREAMVNCVCAVYRLLAESIRIGETWSDQKIADSSGRLPKNCRTQPLPALLL